MKQDRVHDGREAVGHDFQLAQDRWKTAERLGQVLIALDLKVHPADDFVERHPLLRVVLILPGDFVQGIGHVEGVVLVLGVEDERQLVATLGHLHQPLVLALVALVEPGPHVFDLLVLLMEFGAQDAEGLGEIAFVENGERRDGGKQCQQQYGEGFLFHPL